MGKSVALIENEYQLKTFLENKIQFINVLPIVFNFKVEKKLKELNIEYFTEENFEKESAHAGINKKTLSCINQLFNEIEITYKDILLLPLFYVELYQLISVRLRYSGILKEIIKKQDPGKIFVFRSRNEKDIYSQMAESLHANVINEDYIFPTDKKSKFINIAGALQNIISRRYINKEKVNNKNIIISMPKQIAKPLLHHLIADRRNTLVKLSNHPARGFFINKKYVPSYEIKGKQIVEKEKLIKKIEIYKSKLKKTNYLKKLGFPKELVPVMEKWLNNFFDNKVMSVSKNIEEINRLCNRNKIDLVLLHSDVDLFQRTLVETVKKHKIPTIVIQHGICGHHLGYVPLGSDYFICWGLNSAKRLRGWGMPAEKLRILGAPQYDKFQERLNVQEKNVVLYCINSNDYMKTIPGHPTKNRQKDILRSIFSVMKKFPEYKLIVKTKPGWSLDGLVEEISKEGGFSNLEVIEKTDNLKLMQESKIVIVVSSAMGAEAILLRKPVISYYYKDLKEYFPYNKKAIKIAYSEKQLEKAIEGALENKNRHLNDKYLEEEFFKADGKSGFRIVNFIQRILENEQNNL